MKHKFKVGDLVRFQRWGVGDVTRQPWETRSDNGVVVGFADRRTVRNGRLEYVDVPIEEARWLRITTPDGQEHVRYIPKVFWIAKGSCK